MPEPPPLQPAGKSGTKKSPLPDTAPKQRPTQNRPAVLPLAREGAAWGGGQPQPQGVGSEASKLLYAQVAGEYDRISLTLGGYSAPFKPLTGQEGGTEGITDRNGRARGYEDPPFVGGRSPQSAS